MNSATAIKHVVLDFDGTCTQIPKVWETYLELYFKALPEAGFKISAAEWSEACNAVRIHSPKAAWTLAGCAAAPAAADPYILADEAMRLILRRRGDRRPVPPEINAKAYGAAPAPWREETLDTFARLIEGGIQLHFVSNSSTVVIAGRLQELLANRSSLRDRISVQSDAGKFRVCELEWDEKMSPLSPAARKRFEALPTAWNDGKIANAIGRPVYLRRAQHTLVRSAAYSAAILPCFRKPCFAATSGKWIWLCRTRLEPMCICSTEPLRSRLTNMKSRPSRHVAGVQKPAPISVAYSLGFEREPASIG
jgi:hypothetical protein